MKAILIDVVNHQISLVDVSNNIKDIYKHLNCDMFECVDIDHQNTIYVDEEGLLKLDERSKFFRYKGYPQPICGNGLVLGINHHTGDSIDCSLSVEDIKSKVEFLCLAEVMMINGD